MIKPVSQDKTLHRPNYAVLWANLQLKYEISWKDVGFAQNLQARLICSIMWAVLKPVKFYDMP